MKERVLEWAGKIERAHARLVDLLVPGDRADSLDHRRVSVLLCWIYLELMVAPGFLLLYGGLTDHPLLLGAVVATPVGLLIIPALIRMGALSVAGNWLVATLYWCVLVVASTTGGVDAPAFAWFVILPAAAAILTERRAGIAWFVISAVTILTFLGLELSGDFAFPNVLESGGGSSILRWAALTSLVAFLLLLAAQHQYLREWLYSEVQRERDNLDALLDSVPDAVLAVDGSGRITRGNESARRLFGLSRTVPGGDTIDRLIPTLGQSTLDNSDGIQGPQRGHRGFDEHGDEIPLSISWASYGSADRRYVIIARDVSGEQALEHELRQSQKMEAVGRLAGGVAHDFKNLLSVLSGHAEFLRAAVVDDPTASEDLDFLLGAVDRGASLVDQMLIFSGSKTREPELLDVSEAITTAAGMLRRVVGDDIDLEVDIDPGASTTRIHRSQLEQIVFNMALNARDAMPEGGTLHLRTRFEVADEMKQWSVIELQDTGVGIAPEVRERIFEPFFTTKEVGEGTGFGLATAHGIVREAGGFIDVQSEVGAGTTFSVWLPFCTGEAPERAEDAPPPFASGDATVLVIEDDPALRKLARRVLESRGFCVLDAADGQDAVDLVNDSGTTLDLIFSDVIMPRLGGLEAVRQIREHQPDVRAIFVSGFPGESVDELSGLRSDRFMPKPYTPRELHQIVDDVLGTPDRQELA